MPTVDLPTGASVYYEEHGEGFPVLLFAPGGMDSRLSYWETTPWNPVEVLSPNFRVIAMDQRNAGQSFGPLEPTGWDDFAADHIALLDHLNIERAHLVGGCIGSSYCLRLIHDAPRRIDAAILQNPIGLKGGNFDSFVDMFTTAATTAESEGMAAVVAAARENAIFQQNPQAGFWANHIAADEDFAVTVEAMDPTVYAEAHRETAARLFGRSDFVFSVEREWVDTCAAKLLVLAGNDDFHPASIAEEIAHRGMDSMQITGWDAPERKAGTEKLAFNFLERNIPKGTALLDLED